mgnify:CR=1 FL=1
MLDDRKGNEMNKEIELIKNIIKTREELKNNNKNFEFAELDLVDYYIYQIKANLNYLFKLAKAKGITIDSINQIEYSNYEEEIS